MATENLKETVKDTASKAVDATKEGLSEAAQAAKAQALHTAEEQVQAGKDRIADEGDMLALGLQDAADAQRPDSLQAKLLDNVAGSLAGISSDLRQRDIGSLLDEVDGFAHRNPGAFVAGAALLGFAALRFARASAENSVGSSDGYDNSDAMTPSQLARGVSGHAPSVNTVPAGTTPSRGYTTADVSPSAASRSASSTPKSGLPT